VPVASQFSTASIAAAWSTQPLLILAMAISLGWYLRATKRCAEPWPVSRTVWFCIGSVLVLLLGCGPAAHYARSVYWVWVSQVLALLLIAPLPLMTGQPIALAQLSGTANWLATAGRSRLGRWLASPLVGPALVPVLCVGLLFGPLPGLAAAHLTVAWLVQLALIVLGSAIVYPLVSLEDSASSVAVGMAVAVGFVELLADAVPGIVLRLSTHPVSSFFQNRLPLAGAPSWLHDQQIGGGVLWCVAELLDLPFLVLIFRRWVRADAREAAVIDAQLDAEADTADTDTPWFLSDPRLRDRLR
jgi:putative membrane protein